MEEVIAHTSRILTTAEAAREWDAMTKPTTRVMVDLPSDLEYQCEPFSLKGVHCVVEESIALDTIKLLE